MAVGVKIKLREKGWLCWKWERVRWKMLKGQGRVYMLIYTPPVFHSLTPRLCLDASKLVEVRKEDRSNF